MSVITLLTDFGMRDGYHGVMKGVIWSILPEAQIADISHNIPPQNVFEGARVLARAAFFFPPGTVHAAVVDPGVGTTRRPIALKLGDYYFVGPDNGLFTLVLERSERLSWPIACVVLNRKEYWLPQVSSVFHGRDIFSPVAAHLASGVPLGQLGTPISDPIRLEYPRPVPIENGWRAKVVAVDIFGNLSINLDRTDLEDVVVDKIRIAGHEIDGLVHTFGDRPPGELVALIDSSGELSICVVNGSAAERLGISIGAACEVITAGQPG